MPVIPVLEDDRHRSEQVCEVAPTVDLTFYGGTMGIYTSKYKVMVES